MATKILIPPIKWAQRKDRLFLTIEVSDITDEKVNLIEPNILQFSGQSAKQQYEASLEFNGDIDVNESKWTKFGRSLQLNIKKKEEGPFWNKLTKDDKKFSNLKVDWDKWVDEDEEVEEVSAEKNLGGGWDPSSMQGFGGEDDSDDEDNEQPGKNLDDLDQDEEIDTGKPLDNTEEESKEEKKE